MVGKLFVKTKLLFASCMLFFLSPSAKMVITIISLWIMNTNFVFLKNKNTTLILNIAHFIFDFYIVHAFCGTLQLAALDNQKTLLTILIIELILYSLFWICTFHFFKKIKNRLGHLLVIPISASIYFIPIIFDKSEFLKLICNVLFWMSLRAQWYIMLEIQGARRENRIPRLLNTLNPFWSNSIIPFASRQADSVYQKEKLFNSGFICLCFCSGVSILLSSFFLLEDRDIRISAIMAYRRPSDTFGKNIEHYFNFYRTDALSFGDRWIVVLSGFVVHLYDLINSTLRIVAVARMCGFNVFRYVYKPYSSKSFYECLTRSNYHYVEVITQLLMDPLLQMLKFIKRIEWRVAVSAFTSIFIVGYWFHFARWPQAIIVYGVATYTARYYLYSVYFIIIALAAAASLFLNLKKNSNHQESKLVSIMRNSFYFLFYASIHTILGTDFFLVDAADHLHFFKSLFKM